MTPRVLGYGTMVSTLWRPALRLTLAMLPALLSGCGELDPYRGPGSARLEGTEALVVSPALLDFGTLRAGASPRTLPFTVQNAGDTTLTVHGHDEVLGAYDADAPALFTIDAPPVFELAPGALQQFAVTFAPSTQGQWEGRIDVNDGIEVLELRGAGSAPVVGTSSPARATAAFGCSDELVVDIFNQGDQPLNVSDIDVLSPDPAWSLQLDPSPFQLAPGGRTEVRVTFAPRWDEPEGGLRNALMQVVSDDPAHPELSLNLEAVAYESGWVEESFSYRPGHRVDLLVVAQTDALMSAYASHFADASPTLVGILEDNNISLHLAGLTTGGLCPHSEPAWTDADASPATRAAVLGAAMDGSDGTRSTMLLEHAIASLTERPSCLTGFLRADSQLHVVLVAGGPDQSPRSVEAQLAELRSTVPAASGVTVSAAIPVTAEACAGTAYGAGYADMVIDTEGAIADLCAPSFADGMEAIAGASLRASSGGLRHALAQPPQEASITVKVDGLTWTAWTYDPLDQAIVFSADEAPETGAWVQVAYAPESDC